MNYYISTKQMEEIKERAERAFNATSMMMARKDIDRIRIIVSEVYGANRLILSEMSSAVIDAAGPVRDKERKVRIARESICKVEMYCVKDYY